MSDLLEITDENFVEKVMNSDKPVLIDFWAPWCAPCRIMGPEVEKAAVELGDKVVVGKMNVDENQRVAGALGIMSIPTLALFKDKEVVWHSAGARPAAALVESIEEALKS